MEKWKFSWAWEKILGQTGERIVKKKKKQLKKNDIKIDDIYFLQMDKRSLSDIKELVQGQIANKVKDPGFKFSQLGYSQYGPNH